MVNILFVNSKEEKCGVHQFGARVSNIIVKSQRYHIHSIKTDNAVELEHWMGQLNPKAVIYNYHPATMGWLIPRNYKGRFTQFTLFHEVPLTDFDYYIYSDPTLGNERFFWEYYKTPNDVEFTQGYLSEPHYLKTGRPLFEHKSNYPNTLIPVIGSFGFGLGGKNYNKIVEIVNEEFDEAIIRFNIPFATFGDSDGTGAKRWVELCQQEITKPGIKLTVKHDFLNDTDLLNFLAGNTINVFCYDDMYGRGIASATDYGLSVKKPLAITKSHMFRHIWPDTEEICLENNSISNIIKLGSTPTDKFRERWTHESLIKDFERILDSVI